MNQSGVNNDSATEDDPLFGGLERRMVVFAPHADDEVLGAGGLMARAAAAGWMVHASFATISGFKSEHDGSESVTRARVAEVEAAIDRLGAAGHDALFEGGEWHLRLDTVPQARLIGFVERTIKQQRPSVAVVPGRGHHHQDHRALADACVAALRPAPDGLLPFVPAVLAYGHNAAGWGGETFAFRPSVFIDITAVIDQKLAALAAYESQLFEPPHPRSLAAVRACHAQWGAYAGVEYAEPFECLRLAY